MKKKHYEYFKNKGPKDYDLWIYYSFIKNHIENDYTSNIKEVKKFLIKFGKEPFKFIIDFLDLNFERILLSRPEKLIEIEIEFYELLAEDYSIETKKDLKLVNDILKLVFNYEKFTTTKNNFWNPNIYNQLLKVSVCPYCNSQYTFTQKVTGTKVRSFQIRPDLDHFFVQSKHPMLVISLYNLVPSCNICNSKLKGDKDGKLNISSHPFLESFDQIAYFKRDVELDETRSDFYSQIMGIDSDYTLKLVPYKEDDKKKVGEYEEIYQLTERYKMYKNIINKSIKKSLLYTHNYLIALNKSYPFDEFKKSIAADLDELDSVVLSKVKKDILVREILPNMNPK